MTRRLPQRSMAWLLALAALTGTGCTTPGSGNPNAPASCVMEGGDCGEPGVYRSLDDVSSAQGTTLRLSLDDLAEAKADWVLVEVVLARTADVETDLQVSLDFPEEVSAGPAAAVGRRGQACWTNRLGEGGGETAVFLYGAGPFVQTSGASQGVLQDHTLTPFEIGLTMSESRRELPSLRSVSLLFGLGEAAVWAEREGSRFELDRKSVV